MARPRKSIKEKLTHLVSYRVTQTEFSELHALALKAGLRPNRLARMLTVGRNRNITIQTTKRSDPALIAHMQRLCWDFNQLVQNPHNPQKVSPKLEADVAEIRAIVQAEIDREGEE